MCEKNRSLSHSCEVRHEPKASSTRRDRPFFLALVSNTIINADGFFFDFWHIPHVRLAIFFAHTIKMDGSRICSLYLLGMFSQENYNNKSRCVLHRCRFFIMSGNDKVTDCREHVEIPLVSYSFFFYVLLALCNEHTIYRIKKMIHAKQLHKFASWRFNGLRFAAQLELFSWLPVSLVCEGVKKASANIKR